MIRSFPPFAALLTAAVLAAGCAHDEPARPEAAAPKAGATDATAQVKKKGAELATAVDGLAFEKRQEFEAALRKQVQEMDQRLAVLRDQAGQVRDDARSKYEEALRDFEKRRTEAVQRLDGISSTTSEAWAEFRTGGGKAVDEMRQSLDSIQKLF